MSANASKGHRVQITEKMTQGEKDEETRSISCLGRNEEI